MYRLSIPLPNLIIGYGILDFRVLFFEVEFEVIYFCFNPESAHFCKGFTAICCELQCFVYSVDGLYVFVMLPIFMNYYVCHCYRYIKLFGQRYRKSLVLSRVWYLKKYKCLIFPTAKIGKCVHMAKNIVISRYKECYHRIDIY